MPVIKRSNRSHNLWDCNWSMMHLMLQLFIKHIVSQTHILYGLSLFLMTWFTFYAMKGQFVSSSGQYFTKKNRWIENPRSTCRSTCRLHVWSFNWPYDLWPYWPNFHVNWKTQWSYMTTWQLMNLFKSMAKPSPANYQIYNFFNRTCLVIVFNVWNALAKFNFCSIVQVNWQIITRYDFLKIFWAINI